MKLQLIATLARGDDQNRHRVSFLRNALVFFRDNDYWSKLFHNEAERGAVMRSRDPELMKQIHDYIDEFYIDKERTPATTEIALAFNI